MMAFRSKDLPPRVRAMMAEQERKTAPGRVAADTRLESVTVTLPLPPKSLSPNARCHWRQKARDVADARSRALYGTIIASGMSRLRWKRSTLQATFYHAQRRRRDDDNLIASLKAYRDGLVDAGLLDDDCGVTTLPVVKLIDRDRPRVVLTITRTENDQ